MNDIINKKKENNMFNILSKKRKEETPKQSTAQIVQQIHKEFYTEVDALTEWAGELNEAKSDKNDLLEKEARLRRLGFSNTKEMEEAKKEKKRLERIRSKNREKKYLLEAINYFSQKYPQYKFITEKSVQKICEKYGLVYGEISRYEGTVPDKNLDHMEAFSIKKEDCCYVYNRTDGRWSDDSMVDFDMYETIREEIDNSYEFSGYGSSFSRRAYEASLEIAAPQSDFNMKGYEVEGFKVVKKPIEIPDPVVLQPVMFKKQKHYLIVTAWGDEAADELVVNEKMN